MAKRKVKVAIEGIGNCASPLLQGISFYGGGDSSDRSRNSKSRNGGTGNPPDDDDGYRKNSRIPIPEPVYFDQCSWQPKI